MPDPEELPPSDGPLDREEDLPQYATLTARTPSLLLQAAAQPHDDVHLLHLHQLAPTGPAAAAADLAQLGFLTPQQLPELPSVGLTLPDRQSLRAGFRHAQIVELTGMQLLLVQQAHRTVLRFGAHPRTAARSIAHTDAPDGDHDGDDASSEGSFQSCASGSAQSAASTEAAATGTGVWVVPVKPIAVASGKSPTKRRRPVEHGEDGRSLSIDWPAVRQAAAGAADVPWRSCHAGAWP